MQTTTSGGRSALIPAAGLPLLYFGFAHLCLALALATLLVQPALPGPFFLHPQMIAVVHLVTLGWISGSILGAFYIVAPLALGVALRPGVVDRVAFGSFASGVAGMVAHFWLGEYHGMVWSALLVLVPVVLLACRFGAGASAAAAPWPVTLHVALAFVNMLAASVFGMVIGLNRLFGWFFWSPLSAAYAHAHLAAVGWALMMVVGLSYRLVPMILPAAMPAGASMAASAVLIQSGLAVLVVTLLAGSVWAAAGAALIVLGLVSFCLHVRWIVRRRRSAPAAMQGRDWATWQTHAAFVALLAATALGLVLALPVRNEPRALAAAWWYGTVGLVGFLSQIVLGMQGRLLPLHAWYRAFEAGGMRPPRRSAHERTSPALAFTVFTTWTFGVPLLAYGLAAGWTTAIAAGSATLLAGVVANAVQAALTVSLHHRAVAPREILARRV